MPSTCSVPPSCSWGSRSRKVRICIHGRYKRAHIFQHLSDPAVIPRGRYLIKISLWRNSTERHCFWIRVLHELLCRHHSRNCWNAQHIIWVPGNSLPLCSTPPWLCVPCVSPDISQKKAKPITFCQGLRLVMGHGPYVKLVLGFLFISLAFMVQHSDLIQLYVIQWIINHKLQVFIESR